MSQGNWKNRDEHISENAAMLSKLIPAARLSLGQGRRKAGPDDFHKGCTTCPLFKSSLRVPPWRRGNKILFLGIAPGREDKGEPFGGDIGKLVRGVCDASEREVVRVRDMQFKGVGLHGQYSLDNISKCRPYSPDGSNRDPDPRELEACAGQLNELIEELKPELIVVFGAAALKAVLPDVKDSISNIHGQVYPSRWGIPVMPAIHPYAALSSNAQTVANQVQQDLEAVARYSKTGKLLDEEFEIEELETPEQIDLYTERYVRGKAIAYDMENAPGAEDLYSTDQRLLTVAFAHGRHAARYVVLEHPEGQTPVYYLREELRKVNEDIASLTGTALENARLRAADLASRIEFAVQYLRAKMDAIWRLLLAARRVIAHNAGYEWQLTWRFWGKALDNIDDSFLLHKAVDPLSPGALDELGAALGYRPWKNIISVEMARYAAEHQIRTTKKYPFAYDVVPVKKLGRYNAIDTCVTLASWEEDEKKARQRGKIWKLYEFHMQPLMTEVAAMKRNGMALDLEAWAKAEERLRLALEKAERNFYFHPDFIAYYATVFGIHGKEVDGEFVPEDGPTYLEKVKTRFKHKSPKRVSELIYKVLGWPILGYNREIKYSEIEIGVGDGVQRVFTIHALQKRNKGLKDSPLDYTFDHQVWVEHGGARHRVELEKTKSWSLGKDHAAMRAFKIDLQGNGWSGRVVRYLSEAPEMADQLILRRAPPVGAKIKMNCTQRIPTTSGKKLVEYQAMAKMGVEIYDLASIILDKNDVHKLYSVYVKPAPEKRSSDSLIHPSFNAYAAVTGRHTSEWHTLPWDEGLKSMYVSKFRSEPTDYTASPMLTNFHREATANLDKPGKPGKDAKKQLDVLNKIRGGGVVQADQAQLELRVGAALSGDRELLQIFKDGALNPSKPQDWAQIFAKYGKEGYSRQETLKQWALWTDPHRVVAHNALGRPIDKVNDAERRFCKMIHFGIFYLRSAKSCAQQLFERMRSDYVRVVDGVVQTSYPAKALLWLVVGGENGHQHQFEGVRCSCGGTRVGASELHGHKVATADFRIHLGTRGLDGQDVEAMYEVHFDELVVYCQKIIDGYYRKYSGVKEWQLRKQRIARERHMIVMEIGREVPLPVNESNWNQSVKPVNYPIQGQGADKVNRDLVVIARTLKRETEYIDLVARRAVDAERSDIVRAVEQLLEEPAPPAANIFMTVHDSIYIDSRIPEIDYVTPITRFVMEDGSDFPYLDVPFKADTAVGVSVGQKIELDPHKYADTGAWIRRSGQAGAVA